MIGRTLGHYRIVEKLGEGGMGVVYAAQDLHLDRLVALKILPPEKLAAPEPQQRLMQEAKAASALNHPHIITIYDIASEGGVDFIAMEYVAGKTLDQLIPRKGMRLNEALKIAVQVADALAAAHAIGIIHRDIKPSNIMLSDQGRAKVLDFGLAKLQAPAGVASSETRLTTMARTGEGRIVGTVSYMSPEQAQGRPVDERSDIFSFGSLLYEMVSGQRPFQGDSSITTLAAIIEKEPPSLSGEIPADLEKILARCLRKDAARRYQHMADVRVELQDLVQESDSQASRPAAKAPARRRLPWILATAVSVGILAAAGWLLFAGGGDQALPPQRVVPVTSTPGSETLPALSPDGRQVAFQWNGEDGKNRDIYVQVIGETKAHRLTHDPADDSAPVWSPDGTRIAFRRGTSLFTMSAVSGDEQKVTDVPDLTDLGSWSPNGRWLAVARGRPAQVGGEDPAGLYLVPVAGGDPVRLTSPQAPATDSWPCFSWDGRSLAFARNPYPNVTSDLFIQALTTGGQAQGSPRQLTHTGMLIPGLTWHRDGRSIIYAALPAFQLGYLYQVRLEGGRPPERLDVAGAGATYPSASPRSDRLVFAQETDDIDIWRIRPGGTPEPLIRSSLADYSPDLSPDGSRVAFTSNRTGESTEIWIANADGTNPAQLTHGPGRDQGAPRWSPDGLWLAFDSYDAKGQSDIYVIASSGGQARHITTDPSDDSNPNWSRDGRWIYFMSGRTGRNEVWRAPFAGGEPVQVTRAGGGGGRESTDGKTLFYRKSGSEMFARPLDGGHEEKMLFTATGSFAVVENGIYHWAARGSDGLWPLMCFDLSSRSSSVVARIAADRVAMGLAASPDRKTVLYAASLTSGSDLKLIEHFR
jgi:eukaryotic-like serine/threonine-protein kinase